MELKINQGWLEHANKIPSPNYDDRPEKENINLVVIHNISLPPGDFGGDWINALFTNTLDPDAHPYFKEIADTKVSAHLLVRRDGEVIQYVPFEKRAWHAGESSYKGRHACNDFSIGIELEGTDNIAYEDIQYEKLIEIFKALKKTFPALTQENIVGHCNIAPDRKTDPGQSFDWDYLYRCMDNTDIKHYKG